MKYLILSIAVTLGLSVSAQSWVGENTSNPIDGDKHGVYLWNGYQLGALNFIQFEQDKAGEVTLYVRDGYFCADYSVSVQIAVQDAAGNTTFNDTFRCSIYTGSEAAGTDVKLGCELIQALKAGHKAWVVYTDSHCGREMHTIDLAGFTAAFAKAKFRI